MMSPEDGVGRAQSNARFPTPDRSNQKRQLGSPDRDGVLDFGYYVGNLSQDGRPIFAERWRQDEAQMVTFFMSTEGIESFDRPEFENLLEDENLVNFVPGQPKFAAPAKWIDAKGNEMWSVNVVLGDTESTFANSSLDFVPYSS